MMKSFRKILCMALTFAMLLTTVFVATAGAASAQDVVGGRFNGMPWQYDTTNGQLAINGQGALPSDSPRPWQEYEQQVDTAIFRSGITTIPDGFMNFCVNMTTIMIPASVTYIGEGVLTISPKLTDIIYEGDLDALLAIQMSEADREVVKKVHVHKGTIAENNSGYSYTFDGMVRTVSMNSEGAASKKVEKSDDGNVRETSTLGGTPTVNVYTLVAKWTDDYGNRHEAYDYIHNETVASANRIFYSNGDIKAVIVANDGRYVNFYDSETDTETQMVYYSDGTVETRVYDGFTEREGDAPLLLKATLTSQYSNYEVEYEYDGRQLIGERNSYGTRYSYEYNKENNTKTKYREWTTFKIKTDEWTYNDNGEEISHVQYSLNMENEETARVTNIYNEKGQLIESITNNSSFSNQNGKKTYEYDANGKNAKTILEQNGYRRTTIFNDGKIESVIVEEITDNADEKDKLVNTQKYEYQPNGRLTKVILKDAEGNVLSTNVYEYDYANRIQEINTVQGDTVTTTKYDEDGNKIEKTVRQADGSSETTYYENDGMQLNPAARGEVRDKDGNITAYVEYDANGQEISVTSYNLDRTYREEKKIEGGVQITDYTADGKKTASVSYYDDGNKAEAKYDADGNLSEVTMIDVANGITQTTEYENGTPSQERAVSADGTIYDVVYSNYPNTSSVTITRTDGTKNITTYYENGETSSLTSVNADGESATSTYDENGNRTSYAEYDADGNETYRQEFDVPAEGVLTKGSDEGANPDNVEPEENEAVIEETEEAAEPEADNTEADLDEAGEARPTDEDNPVQSVNPPSDDDESEAPAQSIDQTSDDEESEASGESVSQSSDDGERESSVESKSETSDGEKSESSGGSSSESSSGSDHGSSDHDSSSSESDDSSEEGEMEMGEFSEVA